AETGESLTAPCNDWLFRVDPPAALLTQHQIECISIVKRIRWLERRVKAKKRRLSRARSRATRRVLRREVRRKKRALKKARQLAAGCS
ncbi:MAG TPA: hypothetical protein VF729_03760, partial [Solirubrobacterales bacterium]